MYADLFRYLCCMNENFLEQKLAQRRDEQAFRSLRLSTGLEDWSSNDYLGLVRYFAHHAVESGGGATGSRLLSGNHAIMEETERMLADFHETEAALIFNSGYDANLGLLSVVPQKEDLILYDFLSHASIRDGIKLNACKSHSFLHNDLVDLERHLARAESRCFVVTESVFSMDGDMAPLVEIAALCERYHAYLIVDEAHSTGVVGEKGQGLVQQLGIEDKVFARVHTFGKALGSHGAVVVGSTRLRDYLINFSRAFIYTTALPPNHFSMIQQGYQLLPGLTAERDHLNLLIKIFQDAQLPFQKLESLTPIQAILIPGNERARLVAHYLQSKGHDCRPILYPTVPRNTERLRIILHSYNSVESIQELISVISEAGRLF